MQTPSFRGGQAAGLPLTHAAFFAASTPGYRAPRVQIRKYHPEGPCVLCAQVLEVHDNNGQWFKVSTAIGTLWAESKNVRMCSGDGLCTCEADAPAAT
jgi:hypothetical protein